MKDILIVAHFTQTPGEPGNGRFNYLATELSNRGYRVEIVSTKFSHRTKKNRVESPFESAFKITLLNETGYTRNVSLKRFYSHYSFGINLKKYLKNRKKPDLIYCAVPSLDAGYVAAQYAKSNNIKFIIDVQDLWPEAFKLVFNTPLISNIIFSPMKLKAHYIYKNADDIIAVSDTYLRRVLEVNNKNIKGSSAYLGTDLQYFDDIIVQNPKINKPSNEVWIAYIGTLGHSYNIEAVIDALKHLKDNCTNNIKFIVMGDGPLKSRFEDYAKQRNINHIFTGRLQYEEMVTYLRNCDIAVNPIKKRSAASIINKVGDYAAAGLPVINTQESEEYRGLLEKYEAGLNCQNDNHIDIAEKIRLLISNSDLIKRLGKNSRLLAERKFDRRSNYKSIISKIEKYLK
ncbi:glycosyltransferase family 4 protein [Terribacillus saccharophilus]|uniref:glycosyltransferase family 4 protein n=1 Tax=Terribacillus saccharophilus TaxID=361277 RepID=UPI003981E6E2